MLSGSLSSTRLRLLRTESGYFGEDFGRLERAGLLFGRCELAVEPLRKLDILRDVSIIICLILEEREDPVLKLARFRVSIVLLPWENWSQ
jgi:hypothetical protein